jgi:hypothetical protein
MLLVHTSQEGVEVMKVNSNGSKWLGDAPDSIDVLLDVLSREPLDPAFEEYGNFVLSHPPGVRVWGNFLNLSHVFSVDGSLDELKPVVDAIRANQKRPDYLAARKVVAS